MLDKTNGPSFLAASLSMAAELLEGRVDAAASNGSAREPGWHCLPPYHTFWSWKLIWSCLGLGATQT
jgi:hypothetical protein